MLIHSFVCMRRSQTSVGESVIRNRQKTRHGARERGTGERQTARSADSPREIRLPAQKFGDTSFFLYGSYFHPHSDS